MRRGGRVGEIAVHELAVCEQQARVTIRAERVEPSRVGQAVRHRDIRRQHLIDAGDPKDRPVSLQEADRFGRRIDVLPYGRRVHPHAEKEQVAKRQRDYARHQSRPAAPGTGRHHQGPGGQQNRRGDERSRRSQTRVLVGHRDAGAPERRSAPRPDMLPERSVLAPERLHPRLAEGDDAVADPCQTDLRETDADDDGQRSSGRQAGRAPPEREPGDGAGAPHPVVQPSAGEVREAEVRQGGDHERPRYVQQRRRLQHRVDGRQPVKVREGDHREDCEESDIAIPPKLGRGRPARKQQREDPHVHAGDLIEQRQAERPRELAVAPRRVPEDVGEHERAHRQEPRTREKSRAAPVADPARAAGV